MSEDDRQEDAGIDNNKDCDEQIDKIAISPDKNSHPKEDWKGETYGSYRDGCKSECTAR